LTIAINSSPSGIISKDIQITNNSAHLRINKYDKVDQITFINSTHSYCICVIDIVNSTRHTEELASSEKIRIYYSIFLNTMASIIKNHNGQVVKNAGDCLVYYFLKTVDSSNESAFREAIDCGLSMIKAGSIINPNLNKNNLSSIAYRISANYGKVELATSINSNSIDLFGPTVNICSKINHLASSNEMVIYKDFFDVINETQFFKEYCFREIIKNENNEKCCTYPYKVYSVNRIDQPIQQQQQKHQSNETRYYNIQEMYSVQNQNKQNKINSSFNILIIDDDEDIIFAFKTVIEGEGYNVVSYSDLYKAWDHFLYMSPYHFDLVLLDIHMPGINGIKLYSKIKVINPDIKVLFISALDACKEMLSIFPDIKSSDIIRKPIGRQHLLSKIKTLLKL
jgi:two-component system, OmpR family, response regulator ChvI